MQAGTKDIMCGQIKRENQKQVLSHTNRPGQSFQKESPTQHLGNETKLDNDFTNTLECIDHMKVKTFTPPNNPQFAQKWEQFQTSIRRLTLEWMEIMQECTNSVDVYDTTEKNKKHTEPNNITQIETIKNTLNTTQAKPKHNQRMESPSTYEEAFKAIQRRSPPLQNRTYAEVARSAANLTTCIPDTPGEQELNAAPNIETTQAPTIKEKRNRKYRFRNLCQRQPKKQKTSQISEPNWIPDITGEQEGEERECLELTPPTTREPPLPDEKGPCPPQHRQETGQSKRRTAGDDENKVEHDIQKGGALDEAQRTTLGDAQRNRHQRTLLFKMHTALQHQERERIKNHTVYADKKSRTKVFDTFNQEVRYSYYFDEPEEWRKCLAPLQSMIADLLQGKHVVPKETRETRYRSYRSVDSHVMDVVRCIVKNPELSATPWGQLTHKDLPTISPAELQTKESLR